MAPSFLQWLCSICFLIIRASAISSAISTTSSTSSSSSASTTASSTTSPTSSTSTASATSTAATGWSYMDCYSDSVSGRTLTHLTPTVAGADLLTVEGCTTACHLKGFTLAGLEWSRECWCGNTISNGGAPITDGGCNMPCAGDKTQTCGGSVHLSVYQYAAPAQSPWSPLGCYADSVTARILKVRMAVTGGTAAMSVEACTTACWSQGYALAGLEFSQECFCGDTIVNGGYPASGCDMACKGNTDEICGGSNRMNIFQNGVVSSSSSTSTTTSTSSTSTTTSTSSMSTTTSPSSTSNTASATHACSSFAIQFTAPGSVWDGQYASSDGGNVEGTSDISTADAFMYDSVGTAMTSWCVPDIAAGGVVALQAGQPQKQRKRDCSDFYCEVSLDQSLACSLGGQTLVFQVKELNNPYVFAGYSLADGKRLLTWTAVDLCPASSTSSSSSATVTASATSTSTTCDTFIIKLSAPGSELDGLYLLNNPNLDVASLTGDESNASKFSYDHISTSSAPLRIDTNALVSSQSAVMTTSDQKRKRMNDFFSCIVSDNNILVCNYQGGPVMLFQVLNGGSSGPVYAGYVVSDGMLSAQLIAVDHCPASSTSTMTESTTTTTSMDLSSTTSTSTTSSTSTTTATSTPCDHFAMKLSAPGSQLDGLYLFAARGYLEAHLVAEASEASIFRYDSIGQYSDPLLVDGAALESSQSVITTPQAQKRKRYASSFACTVSDNQVLVCTLHGGPVMLFQVQNGYSFVYAGYSVSDDMIPAQIIAEDYCPASASSAGTASTMTTSTTSTTTSLTASTDSATTTTSTTSTGSATTTTSTDLTSTSTNTACDTMIIQLNAPESILDGMYLGTSSGEVILTDDESLAFLFYYDVISTTSSPFSIDAVALASSQSMLVLGLRKRKRQIDHFSCTVSAGKVLVCTYRDGPVMLFQLQPGDSNVYAGYVVSDDMTAAQLIAVDYCPESSGSTATESATTTTSTDMTSTTSSSSSSSTTMTTTTTSTTSTSATSTAASTVSYVGCYSDKLLARTFSTRVYPSGPLTIEKCLTACFQAGHTMAGLEWSRECYCDSTFRNDGVLVTNGCNMQCDGDPDEICGGSLRLSVYSTSNTKTWHPAGCYEDVVAARTLGFRALVPGGAAAMTVEGCQEACKAAGYPIAGLEWAQECFCDTQFRNNAGLATDDGCNMPCKGDGTEICGGSVRLSVYTLVESSAAVEKTYVVDK